MESVYRAVRTGSLNKAVCASSLKVNVISRTVVIRHWDFKPGVWYSIYLGTHLLVGVEDATF